MLQDKFLKGYVDPLAITPIAPGSPIAVSSRLGWYEDKYKIIKYQQGGKKSLRISKKNPTYHFQQISKIKKQYGGQDFTKDILEDTKELTNINNKMDELISSVKKQDNKLLYINLDDMQQRNEYLIDMMKILFIKNTLISMENIDDRGAFEKRTKSNKEMTEKLTNLMENDEQQDKHS